MMHQVAKVFEKVNRKCYPSNTILQLSTPYTDQSTISLKLSTAKCRKLLIISRFPELVTIFMMEVDWLICTDTVCAWHHIWSITEL